MKHSQKIDYLKGVLILLMITFHLVYFSRLHPVAKDIVYTFHMPCFLVISGYLMNVEKSLKRFGRTMLYFFIPYLLLESGYIVLAAYLPIREHIDHFTWQVFVDKFFLHPLGPYWYLRLLIVCGIPYYVIHRYLKVSPLIQFTLLGLFYWGFSVLTDALPLAYAFYFGAGTLLRKFASNFTDVFFSHLFSVVAFAILICIPKFRFADSFGGVFIVYFAMSGLLALYRYMPQHLSAAVRFIGRHTLVIYLFSPIFTLAIKPLVPYVAFDPTGLLLLTIALLVCVFGCLLIGKVFDYLHLSPLIFGKKVVE